MQTISDNDLKTRIDREGDDLMLVDTRGDDAWEGGHIPHAKSIPPSALRERVEGLVEPTSEVIIYGQDGSASRDAAQKLEQMGYQKVIALEDGFTGWKDAGYDTALG
jgi:rhodanese-related sulfurtransferase